MDAGQTMKKHMHLAVLSVLVLVFLVIKSCYVDQRIRSLEIEVKAWTERMETELQRAKKTYDEASDYQLSRKSS